MNDVTLDILLLAAMVLAVLATVMAARVLRAAIGLAAASAVLAVIMFRLGAPIAAVFELSVCAGLIPAIFISAIGLTQRLAPESLVVRRKETFRRFWILPIVVVLVAFALQYANVPLGFPIPPELKPAPDVRDVLWNQRQFDLIGQIVLLLGAALGVVVLLKEPTRD